MPVKLGIYAAGLSVVLCLIGLAAIFRLPPLPDGPAKVSPASVEIVDRYGQPLRTLLVDRRRFTIWTPLSGIPESLVHATLSAEDKRFYHHQGVDLLAMLRAARGLMLGKGPRSGASTITQQLVKLNSPGGRSFARKIHEIRVARRLEASWSKDEILEAYLNQLDYGNLRVGPAAAGLYYFGKPVSDLSLAQTAYLAGLPKAPGRLNPRQNPGAALARQKWVLRRMLEDQRISAESYTRAVAEPIEIVAADAAFEAPHFVDLVLRRRGILPAGGGILKTTLDAEINREAGNILAAQLAHLEDKEVGGGAVVVIDNRTGGVLALAGSGDYFAGGDGRVNGAWAVRSPGSAVKPFAYWLALENGAFPGTVVADIPTSFATPTGTYRPNNYNHRFYGPVSLRRALGNSLNVASIRVLQLAGGPEALQSRLAAAGITTLGHPPEHYGLGLVLGNGGVRLLELTNAYASLARLGETIPYRLIADDAMDPSVRIGDARSAYLVADMLADNHARTATFGADSFLKFDFPVACKTGTSSDYRDTWIVGYTPEFSVGVWVGNPDGTAMRGVTGVSGAAPVFHRLFRFLHRRFGTTWFERPDGVGVADVHSLTGRRIAGSSHPLSVRELFVHEPGHHAGDEIDPDGRVQLGEEYRRWLENDGRALQKFAAISPAQSVRIVEPAPGSQFFIDPDLPIRAQKLILRASGGKHLRWTCGSLDFAVEGTTVRAALIEGIHRFEVRDLETGEIAETWISVTAL